jgi:putative salt-induced outer membrane protein YdiY
MTSGSDVGSKRIERAYAGYDAASTHDSEETPLKIRSVIAFCAAALAFAASARADEIQFKNGDRLTGKIVRLADGKLGFDSKIAGTISVKWDDVATLTSDEPVTVVLDNGDVLVDKLVAADPGSVRTAGSDKVTGQTIVLASAAKLNPEPVAWKGTAVAGADIERGNTVKTAANVALDAVRRAEKDRITFGGAYTAEQSQDADQTGAHTTQRKMFGSLQYDYFLDKQIYVYGNARGEKDGIADLSLRFTAGVGAGYQWFETDTFTWSTEAGLSWVSENYTNDTPNNDYIAARFASNLEYILYPGLTFFQRTRWYPSLQSSQDQLVETATGIRYKIWGNFFGESKVLWIWDTTPAQGKKQEDLAYILGIGYAF